MKKIEPQKDKRYRASKSVSLYVVYSNIHNPNGDKPYIEITDSCERSVFNIKSTEGDFVRYNNSAYKLYSPKSFKKIISRAKKGEVELKHFQGINSNFPSSLNKLAPAHYCVLERSPGHLHRF